MFFFEKKNQKTFYDSIWVFAVGLVAVGLCLPFLRTVLWFADEGIWLSGALRILHGRGLYTETFSIYPPGGYLITAGWFSVFGTSMLSARTLATATVAGIACFTFLAGQNVARYRPLAAAVAVAWAVMTQGLGTQVNHHYFATLFTMIAVWAGLRAADSMPRAAAPERLAFVCAGMATMITPTQGVALAVALSTGLVWPAATVAYARAVTAQIASFAVAPLCMILYLTAHHALVAAYHDTVIYPASRYASIHWVRFGVNWGAANLPLALLFPVVGGLALWALGWRGRALLADRRYRLCVGLAVAGWFAAWPRPDIQHIAFTAPMAMPLLCYSSALSTRAWRRLAVAVIAAVSVPSAIAYGSLLRETSGWLSVPTEQGQIRIPVGYRNRAAIIATLVAAPPADRVFFYPYLMMMPYLTGREQVSGSDIFLPGYTAPDQYRASCAEMLRSADWVVVQKSWTTASFLKTIFPAMGDPDPPAKQSLERAIRDNFLLAGDDAEFEIRRRKTRDPLPSVEASCAAAGR